MIFHAAMSIALILFVAAIVAFVLDAFGVSARVNLTALGLALLTLALLIER